ncbi:MAG: hypothetical protein SP1CHLAM54_03190 [Chlamydiia bacterium]|nr:hypothetical protein [Chlamydiia bacterium]MCH9615235.1 hypothetical protein [Chlamydiia bacterium]MCH9628443.1 hypothetical protein [Chlamydiia bacterium]
MKINHKVLSIPPYISTSWKNINALHVRGNSLIISLNNASVIEVPDLPEAILSEIFTAHESHMENEQEIPETPIDTNFSFGMPIQELGGLGALGGLENITSLMQHNMDKSDSPDLPKEMLDKVKGLTKVMGMDEQIQNMPEAEPHCNCPYCQIARVIADEEQFEEMPDVEEEIVSENELTFREWDIKENGDKQFTVTNPLNPDETYHVFLGTPIGCTCGKSNCEHIKCVLSS